MIGYIKEAINSIVKQIDGHSQSGVYLLYGDEGMGKSTIAAQFSEICENTINFRCSSIYEMTKYFSSTTIKENFNVHLHLLKPLIKKIRKNHIKTLIFDVENDTSKDFLDFIYEIYNTINQQSVNQKSIFEKNISIDVIIIIDSKVYHSCQQIFEEYRILYYLEPLRKWKKTDFIELCNDNEKYNFSEKQFDLLEQYSLGNVGVFFKYMHTLRYYKYLKFIDGCWELVPDAKLEETLQEEYADIVEKKYKGLPKNLQSVIQRTSIIGYNFQNSTLKGAYKINSAKKLLYQIELLTDLLYYTDKELVNGKFDSREVQLQIEKMIEPELLITWCNALARYYENKIEETKFISIERCLLKEKCILYYGKVNNKEKEIFHYVTLISLKFNLGQYSSAIEISKKLFEMTKGDSKYKEINEYCLYTQVQINKAIAKYPEALKCLNNYIMAIKNNSIEQSKEILALNAELLYDVGDIQKAYQTFCSLYSAKDEINDSNLKLNIISMLSSIEQTLNDDKYIKHFNEALAFAKDNQLHKEYYKLLRKANMAHYGENSIVLMENAMEYFDDNKLICEQIMVRHNIGTESLFYESTIQSAFNILKSSYKIATEYGFYQLSYINNSLVIYSIIKGHYEEALIVLNRLLTLEDEDFSHISFLLNKVTCLRSKNLLYEAEECLSIAEELNERQENQFPFFYSQIILQKAYLLIQKENYKNALDKLLEYFKMNYNDRTANIVSVKIVLKRLCTMLNQMYPPVIANFSDDHDNITQRIADNHLVLCELMFWE